MPSITVESYQVGYTDQSASPGWAYLTLKPTSSTAGQIQGISIFFFASRSDAGYETSTWVVSTPPPEKFKDIYDILKTEQPVFFSWASDANSRLYWSSVGTGSEPPGEGFDLS